MAVTASCQDLWRVHEELALRAKLGENYAGRMAYSLVIFDFDGTLADSAAWFRGALRDMAVKHRFKQIADDAEVEHLRGLRTREIIAALGIKMWQLPVLAFEFRQLALAAAGTISLFPGVGELLDDLARRGVVVAVVSSNAEATVRRVLGPREERVAHFSCGSSLFGKASKLTQVVERLGVPRAAVLCVGDETRDVEAAKEAGLTAAAVTWGYATEAALRAAEPDALVASVDELVSLVG